MGSLLSINSIAQIEFLGIELYEDDFLKLLFKLGINFFFTFIIVRGIYYPISKRKDYLFSFFMLSIIIFVLCFILKGKNLDTGMALGLFAIFGIIRYRTNPIPIKEMTYLFMVIGLSVINALAKKGVSIAEILFANLVCVAITYGLEKIWFIRHESVKLIVYEKIDLIKPDKHNELKADLEERTGLVISRFEIGKIDFLRDTAQIRVHYFEDEQNGNFMDEGIGELDRDS